MSIVKTRYRSRNTRRAETHETGSRDSYCVAEARTQQQPGAGAQPASPTLAAEA